MSLENLYVFKCAFSVGGQCVLAEKYMKSRYAEAEKVKGKGEQLNQADLWAKLNPKLLILGRNNVWGAPLLARVSLGRPKDGTMVSTYPCSVGTNDSRGMEITEDTCNCSILIKDYELALLEILLKDNLYVHNYNR